MTDHTSRLSLPLLHSAQAQKEMTHNEALTLIDVLLHGSIERVGEDTPPASATPGQCWIVGDAPVGAWAGQGRRVAAMTAGGWRFVEPRAGMTLWWVGGETTVTFRGGAWHAGEIRATRLMIAGLPVVGPRGDGIAGAAGGNIQDIEARSVIGRILTALRDHGLIDP